jgi:hypothetical protein
MALQTQLIKTLTLLSTRVQHEEPVHDNLEDPIKS